MDKTLQVTDEETIKLIYELIGTNTELKRKLLNLDANAIRSLAEWNYNIPGEKKDRYITRQSRKEPDEKIRKLYFLLLDEYYKKENEQMQDTPRISTK